MRLLLISQDFPPDVGGVQTYAYELARRLTDRCEEVVVIAPALPGAEAVDATLPCEVVRVRASSSNFGIKVGPSILRLARQRGFEVAFHVQWSSALASVLVRPLGGPRLIFLAAHGRELLLEPLAHRRVLQTLYNRTRAFIIRHADGFFPVSHYTSRLLREYGVPPERISVLHNGTDPAHFHPMDAQDLRDELGLDHQKVVLTISRLVPSKGIDTVLRALPQVARHIPDVRYLIGGSGPDRDRLEALTRTLHLNDRVHFLGPISHEDLRRYYNACDVFVMPSREDRPYVEGFGIAFLEANACGKPVVGARSGGIPDAIRDGETGLLVEPDDEADLASTLLRLLCNPELATQLGTNGQRRVLREASWKHVADQLYETLAARLEKDASP